MGEFTSFLNPQKGTSYPAPHNSSAFSSQMDWLSPHTHVLQVLPSPEGQHSQNETNHDPSAFAETFKKKSLSRRYSRAIDDHFCHEGPSLPENKETEKSRTALKQAFRGTVRLSCSNHAVLYLTLDFHQLITPLFFLPSPSSPLMDLNESLITYALLRAHWILPNVCLHILDTLEHW